MANPLPQSLESSDIPHVDDGNGVALADPVSTLLQNYATTPETNIITQDPDSPADTIFDGQDDFRISADTFQMASDSDVQVQPIPEIQDVSTTGSDLTPLFDILNTSSCETHPKNSKVARQVDSACPTTIDMTTKPHTGSHGGSDGAQRDGHNPQRSSKKQSNVPDVPPDPNRIGKCQNKLYKEHLCCDGQSGPIIQRFSIDVYHFVRGCTRGSSPFEHSWRSLLNVDHVRSF